MTGTPAKNGFDQGGAAHRQIVSLQVLRFFAAFLVVVGHAQHELIVRAGAARAGLLGWVPVDWGVGVDIFFVISGFVMAFVTHGQFGAPGASREFMRRRIIRIVPMYWLFTTPIAALAILAAWRGGGALDWPALLFSYLFLPGPQCGEYCFPVFTLGWTLNYEMMFYVIFAIGLLFRERIGLAVVGAAILAFMVMGQLVPQDWAMLHFWGYPIIGEFLIGIVLARLYLGGVRLPRALGWAMVAAGSAAAFLFYQTHSYELLWRLLTGGVPAMLITAGVVLALLAEAPTPVNRWLARGGDASYILYLCHPFAIKAVAAIGAKVGLFGALAPLFIPVSVGAAVVASLLLHHWLERPLVRFLGRWGRRPRAAPADHQGEDAASRTEAPPSLLKGM